MNKTERTISLALKPEQKVDEDLDAQIEVIDEMTDPEEIEATKQMLEDEFDKDYKGESDSTETDAKEDAKKADTEAGKEADTDAENKSDKADKAEDNKADEKAEIDADKDDKKANADKDEYAVFDSDFKLTEDVLNQLPDNLKKTLAKYTGKGVPDLLKALVNKEKMLGGAKKENTAAAIDELDLELGKDAEDAGSVNEAAASVDDEKIAEVSAKLVKNVLKTKYPELPDDFDGEDYNDFLRDLQDESPQKVYEFFAEKKKAEDKVSKDMDNALNLVKNHKRINADLMKDELRNIGDYVAKLGIKPEDVELNLELRNDKGELNPLVVNLLTGEDGSLDPKVHRRVNDKISIIQKGELLKKFIIDVLPQYMVDVMSNERRSAVKKSGDLKKLAPNSLAQGGGGAGSGLKQMSVSELEKADADTAKKMQDKLEKELGVM